MKPIITRLSCLLLGSLLIVGCQNKTEQNPEATEYAATESNADNNAGVPGAMLRPDAQNPVNDNLLFPAGWKYRLDKSDDTSLVGADTTDAVWFVTMKPGWHITVKKPRLVVYHPASTADGTFTASTKIHLFDPGRRNEAYGLVFGGHDLDSANQSYLYFVIRRSGEYLVKQRSGNETSTLVGWTGSDAIVAYTDSTRGTAANTLSVQVTDTAITFSVNDQVVDEIQRGDLVTDGIVGLRFNHGINAHIESLVVTQDGVTKGDE